MNIAEIRAEKINPFITKYSWQTVDFETDAIHSDEQLPKLTEEYAGQMTRDTSAIETLLSEPARVRICFLDDRGKVAVREPQN